MSRGVTGRPYHMRWLPEEWARVAVVACVAVQAGESTADAVFNAQRVTLPKHRWHPLDHLRKLTAGGVRGAVAAKYIAQASGMTPAQREAVLLREVKHPKAGAHDLPEASAPPAPAPKAERAPRAAKAPKPQKPAKEPRYKMPEPPKREDGTLVRWTSREWALIARSARWVAERQPELPLYAQVAEAQAWTLPVDRQRAVTGITQSFYARGGTWLAQQLKEGLDHGWTINTVPFTPPGSVPEPRGIMPELPSLKAERERLAAEATATTQAAEAAEAASAVTSALNAPPPGPIAPAPAGSLAEACNAFAAHMMAGLGTLLETHTRIMAGRFEEKIESTVTSLAAILESGMRKAVHAMVSAELGGDVAPPPGKPDTSSPVNGTGSVEFIDIERERRADSGVGFRTEPTDSEPAPEPLKRIKIDIVGVPNGALASQIRSELPPNVDARIFEPTSSSAYVPHKGRHCIMLIHKIPHSLSRKVKAAGVEPIYVKPTVFYVTHAVDELVRGTVQ